MIFWGGPPGPLHHGPAPKNIINSYATLNGGGLYITRDVPLVTCVSIDAEENWVCTQRNRNGDRVFSGTSSTKFKDIEASGNVTFTGGLLDFSVSNDSTSIELHENGIVFDGGLSHSPVTTGTMLDFSAGELSTGNVLDIHLPKLTV